MKLIGMLGSPYVRKVRIVFAEKKMDYHLVLDDVSSADAMIHTVNPLGKIPCLVLEDGRAIFDSRVICEYVDTLSPVGRLIPSGVRERTDVRCLEALADGITDAVVLVRQECLLHAPEQRSQAWLDRQQRKISDGVQALAKKLGDKTWFAGNAYTLADVAAGCALGYLDYRQPDMNWRELYPNLVKYFDKLSQRQSFIDTAPQQG